MISQRSAVTLAELLVVLAIISVLMGLLLPVIRSVYRAAHVAECMSNLRQVHLAAGLFHEEWGHLPAESNKGEADPKKSPAWFYRLPAYVNKDSVRGRNTVFQCPSFAWGTPEHFDHASPKSFKMNARLDDNGRSQHYILGKIPDESEVVFFATAVAGETGMGQWGHLVPNGVNHDRLGRAVFLFLDGHCEAIDPPASGDWTEVVRFKSARW